jgi:diguanylate cyclase (GGDEF)-like protein/PAS domain S-box-containing protein
MTSERGSSLDVRVAKALSHPLRMRILERLRDRVASPNVLARELDEPLGNVAYHVRVLATLGCVELVEKKSSGAAFEHSYRALVDPELLAAPERAGADEDRLAQVEALGGIGSWTWDIPMDAVTWSDELYRIFGVEPTGVERTYDAYGARIHPDDRVRVRDAIDRALAGSAGYECEHRIVRPDGEVRVVHSRGSVTRDESGAPVRMVGVCQDITDRKQVEEALVHRALHDELTGLPNRGLFRDRLEHALARALRHDTLIAVLFIDLDDFKEVNDRFGHDRGDQALVTIASRITDVLRGNDTIARHGGDEFTVLLETEDPHAPPAVAKRLQTAICEPIAVNGEQVCVDASIGLAIAARDYDPETLISTADAAMYQAKQAR